MTIQNLLLPEEKDILRQAKETADNLLSVTEKLTSENLPYFDHLTKAKEQKEWFDKIYRIFELGE